MSAMNDGGQAFPALKSSSLSSYHADHYNVGGMTLRDYFAGQALAGMCSRESWLSYEDVAASVYRMTDTMLKEREK